MKKKIVKKYAQFSPPYGDGTVSIDCKVSKDWFSPPYGDGTMIRKLAGLALLFSPPYGDGTEIVTKSYYPM